MKKSVFISLVILQFLIVTTQLLAQTNPISPNVDVQIRVTVASKVLDADVLNVRDFGIDLEEGTTTEPLFWVELANTTSEDIDSLKINVTVESSRLGLLLEVEQSGELGFALPANKSVKAGSNTLKDYGFPGIIGSIDFTELNSVDDVLTPNGKTFYTNLTGNLPDDVYRISVFLTRRGVEVARNTQFFGVKPIEEAVDFFLIQPGAEVGTNQSIMTTNPNFRWDGPRNGNYRLLVVKKNKSTDESAEGLLQTALSTSPTLENGKSTNGTLLDFEIVDAIISGNDFTLPPQGVQKLEEGQLYYWQIYYISEQKGIQQLSPSTIWEFSVAKPGETVAEKEAENDLFIGLTGLLDDGVLSDLKENGFKLVRVQYDNKTITGTALLLREIEVIKEKFASGTFKNQ